MQTLWTAAKENWWGDNEDKVSKAPEGPTLGDYCSDGNASSAWVNFGTEDGSRRRPHRFHFWDQ